MGSNLWIITPFMTSKKGNELKIFLMLFLDLFRENVHFLYGGLRVFITMQNSVI